MQQFWLLWPLICTWSHSIDHKYFVGIMNFIRSDCNYFIDDGHNFANLLLPIPLTPMIFIANPAISATLTKLKKEKHNTLMPLLVKVIL